MYVSYWAFGYCYLKEIFVYLVCMTQEIVGIEFLLCRTPDGENTEVTPAEGIK